MIRMMQGFVYGVVAVGMVVMASSRAAADTTCTLIVEAATDVVRIHAGERCGERLTPSSSFKVALSLMGFDSGLLTDADRPEWPYKDEYQTWNDGWKRSVTPQIWLRDSIAWFSQVLTSRLGVERFREYVERFDYGNRDVSGGLITAWLSSTLRISAVEQVAFVRRMILNQLPVSRSATAQTMGIMPATSTTGGWQVKGKTGTGFRRLADGTNDRGRQVGWFIGWARRGDRMLVFARLIEDTQQEAVAAGPRARDTLLAEWDGLVVPRPATPATGPGARP